MNSILLYIEPRSRSRLIYINWRQRQTDQPTMDIDVNWCLTCQKHIEGDHPYCSFTCAPPDARRWPGNDSTGIAAWAADIPPNAPPNPDHPPTHLLNSLPRIAPPCLSLHSTPPPSPASSQTDSPVSTPPSDHPILFLPVFCQSRFYIHVRSWVAPSPAKFVHQPPSFSARRRKPSRVAA